VPIDLGGTICTGISKVAYKRLRDYLGLEPKEEKIIDIAQQICYIHEDVTDHFQADVGMLDLDPPAGWKDEFTEDENYFTYVDEYNAVYQMPKNNGVYFDMVKPPLANCNSIADLREFNLPNPEDESRYITMDKQVRAYDQKNKAYALKGFVGGGLFETPVWLSGFEKFFADLAINPGYAEALLDIFTELRMKYWKKAIEKVGPGEGILVIMEQDDLAAQNTLLISPTMYRKFIKPRHKRVFDHIRSCAAATGREVKIFYHSCGAVVDVIPDLIEEGIDILNPIQVSAKNMDPVMLKKNFGNDISFWGGGVDTQRILPYGSPQEVREEVKRRIDALAPGGGFVFATIHNIQADVPPENIVAMLEEFMISANY
jgi:uroporphyrinogen decarboxylase